MIIIISSRQSLDASSQAIIQHQRLQVKILDNVRDAVPLIADWDRTIVTYVGDTQGLDEALSAMTEELVGDCVIILGPKDGEGLTIAEALAAGRNTADRDE